MCDTSVSDVGLILLAAGGSRRLGTPKQLLRDGEGRSLVQRAAQTTLDSACRPVVAVLGAAEDEVRAELAGFPLTITVNPNWESGLASSVKMGLKALTENTLPNAIIIMLCDQPGLTGALLNKLIAAYRKTSHQIIACEYGGTLGVPALFGQSLFPALTSLTGDEGARRVIRNYSGPITQVPFPKGIIDIDTIQDAKNLRCH